MSAVKWKGSQAEFSSRWDVIRATMVVVESANSVPLARRSAIGQTCAVVCTLTIYFPKIRETPSHLLLRLWRTRFPHDFLIKICCEFLSPPVILHVRHIFFSFLRVLWQTSDLHVRQTIKEANNLERVFPFLRIFTAHAPALLPYKLKFIP